MNVIFLRQFEQSFRGNRSSSSNSSAIQSGVSFELVTVPYPLPIKDVLVTRSLDFWNNGRYRRGTKLTNDKTKNMDGKVFGLLE